MAHEVALLVARYAGFRFRGHRKRTFRTLDKAAWISAPRTEAESFPIASHKQSAGNNRAN